MVEDKSVQRICELAYYGKFKHYQDLLRMIADDGVENIDKYNEDLRDFYEDLDAIEYACTVLLDIENPQKIGKLVNNLKHQLDFLYK